MQLMSLSQSPAQNSPCCLSSSTSLNTDPGLRHPLSLILSFSLSLTHTHTHTHTNLLAAQP